MDKHTNLESLFPEDILRLRSFRRPAEDIYRHLGPYLAKTLTVQLDGPETDLIPESSLRAAAPALRLLLLEKESVNFAEITRALGLLKDPGVDRFVARVVTDWRKALSGGVYFQIEEHSYKPESVLQAWLYGRFIHQDGPLQADVDRLTDAAPFSTLALQLTIVSLSICALNLDNLIARILGEDSVGPVLPSAKPLPDAAF